VGASGEAGRIEEAGAMVAAGPAGRAGQTASLSIEGAKAMNNEITLTVEGWVARPPQRHGSEDSTWVTFRVGSTAWWWDSAGERRDAPTTWFDVRVSQKDLADNVLLSLKNGDPVVVKGRLSQHHWTDRDGKERSSMRINAQSVGPNLRWGKAVLQRRSGEAAIAESGMAATPGAESAPQSAQVVPSGHDDIEDQAFGQIDAALAAGGQAAGSAGEGEPESGIDGDGLEGAEEAEARELVNAAAPF
jgi:single-strand DNA-binding protein